MSEGNMKHQHRNRSEGKLSDNKQATLSITLEVSEARYAAHPEQSEPSHFTAVYWVQGCIEGVGGGEWGVGGAEEFCIANTFGIANIVRNVNIFRIANIHKKCW